jgi:hypothetical protein
MHGYEPTREAAMAAFARRSKRRLAPQLVLLQLQEVLQEELR